MNRKIDQDTEALYKLFHALGGNVKTDEEAEAAVGGKDLVQVMEDLTAAVKSGDINPNKKASEIIKGFCDGSLTEIVIPKGVTKIKKFAFFYQENVEKIEIPSGVTHIGMSAFQECGNKDEPNIDVVIPDTVVEIGSSAFQGAYIKSAKVPSSVTNLGASAFQNSKVQSVELDANIEYTQTSIFQGCTLLEEVKLPETLTQLGGMLFKGCTALEEVYIPASVTSIAKETYNAVFQGCTALTSIKCGFSEANAPAGAPWGATNATVTYDVPAPTEEE